MGVRNLTLQDYTEVLKWLRPYPERDRLEQERLTMPGPRQLTLWEDSPRAEDAGQTRREQPSRDQAQPPVNEDEGGNEIGRAHV